MTKIIRMCTAVFQAQQTPRVGQQAAEHRGGFLGLDVFELAGCSAHEVVEGPPRNHRVVSQDDEGAEDAESAHTSPGRTPPYFDGDVGQAGRGTGAAATTDRDLGNQQRQADTQREQQVNDNKGTTAVFAGDVRESPDIAHADGETDRRQQETPLRRPLLLRARPCCHQYSPRVIILTKFRIFLSGLLPDFFLRSGPCRWRCPREFARRSTAGIQATNRMTVWRHARR